MKTTVPMTANQLVETTCLRLRAGTLARAHEVAAIRTLARGRRVTVADLLREGVEKVLKPEAVAS